MRRCRCGSVSRRSSHERRQFTNPTGQPDGMGQPDRKGAFMKRIIAWAIGNAPGMNVLMVSLLAMGALSMANLRREMFPAFELEVVMVSVPYPRRNA
jgi:hypothetical protein